MPSYRLKTPSSIFHIFNRGVGGKIIFPQDKDRFKFHFILNDLIDKYELNFIVHAYAQMDNHFHLLIETYNEDISRIMYLLGFIFAKYLNQEHDMKGYLFQNRFGSRMIFSRHHFQIAQAYIHNNWFEAGKEINNQNKLFSSYTSFLDGKSIFPHFDPSLSLRFYGRDQKESIENFVNFTKESRKSIEYNLDYIYSDYLYLIKKIANDYPEDKSWLVLTYLLKEYTQACFPEIKEILQFNGSSSALNNRFNRNMVKITSTEKLYLNKRLEIAMNGDESLPRGEIHHLLT